MWAISHVLLCNLSISLQDCGFDFFCFLHKLFPFSFVFLYLFSRMAGKTILFSVVAMIFVIGEFFNYLHITLESVKVFHRTVLRNQRKRFKA